MPRPSPDFNGALGFARDLIRIPSLPGDEERIARRVVREMEDLGFSDAHLDEAGNAIGRVPGVAGGPTVMLSCHLDMVAAGDPAEWEHPPFDAEIAGGFLHGRGAMDIKGPLALQTYAAAALAGRAPGDIVVAHTVYEERGGLGMKRLMASGEVAPDVVIIGESTHGDVCIGHRGRAEVEVLIHGVAGHASAPERARNALDLVPAVLEAARELAADQPEDPVLGTASVAATSIEVLPESRNVIPDRVAVILDWRILPGQTDAELVGRVRSAIESHLPRVPEGFRVDVRMATERQRTWTGLVEEKNLLTPGFLMDPEHPVVVAAATSVGRKGGAGTARVRPWTFATDGGWTSGVHGVPTIGFAPGEERHAHTNTERLALEEAEWAFGRYPPLILAVMEAVEQGASR